MESPSSRSLQRKVARVVFHFFPAVFLSATLFGCGGGGGGGDGGGSAASTVRTGQLIDGRLKGIAYSTGTRSGVTDGAGNFQYEDGQTVQFCIGSILAGQCDGIQLGSSPGKFLLRPGDLVSSPTSATNMLRVLQALDGDNNLNNGIEISTAVAQSAAANDLTIDFTLAGFTIPPATASSLTTALGRPLVLPTAAVANMHGNRSYSCEISGLYRGTYSGSSRGEFQALIQPNGTILIRGRSSVTGDKFKGAGSTSTTTSDAFIVGSTDTGATFTGKLSGSGMTGTWEDVGDGESGTFSGQLQPISVPAGSGDRYKLTYSGDDFGAASILINAGVLSGQLYVGGDDVYGELRGTAALTGITGSALISGASVADFSGRIFADKSSVFLDGAWQTTSRDANGRLYGCLLSTESQTLASVPSASTQASSTTFVTSGSSATTGGSGGTLNQARLDRMITDLTTGGGCSLCWQ